MRSQPMQLYRSALAGPLLRLRRCSERMLFIGRGNFPSQSAPIKYLRPPFNHLSYLRRAQWTLFMRIGLSPFRSDGNTNGLPRPLQRSISPFEARQQAAGLIVRLDGDRKVESIGEVSTPDRGRSREWRRFGRSRATRRGARRCHGNGGQHLRALDSRCR